MITASAPALDGARLAEEAATRQGSEFRCRSCGYGIVVRRLPELCPMCGSHAWDLTPADASRPAGADR
jgi:hypothetical protein